MAIAPVCDFCKKELSDYGALLFSPPDADSNTHKFHVCKECYEKILELKDK